MTNHSVVVGDVVVHNWLVVVHIVAAHRPIGKIGLHSVTGNIWVSEAASVLYHILVAMY